MCYRRETYERFLSGRACWIVALSSFLVVPTGTWARAQVSTTTRTLPPAAATQTTTTIGHQADTRTGQTVSGLSGGDDAAIIGGITGGTALLIWAIHHHEHSLPSPESLFQKGPQVPQNVAMSHLIVDGLIGPGWPVGVDFTLEGQGSLMLDITTADKGQYHQILTNDLNGRGIVITRPPGLPDKVQAATFDLEAIPAAGSNLPPPVMRVYGIAAGEHAVGSIAIDEVTFGPSTLQMNQPAQYGFHSHSDFSNVRADFMYTGLKDNQIVMKQDTETPLSPATPDEHAQGSLQGKDTKGTPGQHLLQIRAWRGDSGDWVVAWSPDVVTLAK